MRTLTRFAAVGVLLLSGEWGPHVSGEPATNGIASVPQIRGVRLDTLVVIYAGGEPGISEEQVRRFQNAVELGRLFYFRNSRARLDLAVRVLVRPGPVPAFEGASPGPIAADLLGAGIRRREFEVAFVYARGLPGEDGGFRLEPLGAFGAYGFAGSTLLEGMKWFPADDPSVDYAACWVFVHGIHRAIDGLFASLGRPDLAGACPYSDAQEPWFPWGGFDGGERFDWIAATLRRFEGYGMVAATGRRAWTAADADGDGFPDDAPHLSADEARFGSSPRSADSDCDGLGDLDEFSAGTYRGSDPARRDTDGDGLEDGQDPYPMADFTGVIPLRREEVRIDGIVESAWARLMSGYAMSTIPVAEPPRVYALWDEEALYLAIEGPGPFEARVGIDGSGRDGFWAGGDSYQLRIGPEGDVSYDGLNEAYASGRVPGAIAAGGPSGCRWDLEVRIPASLGPGISCELNWGSTEKLPRNRSERLTLREGRVLGLNLRLNGVGEGAAHGIALMPNFAYYDAVLGRRLAVLRR